jgi:AraC-like DNA-binding protein
MTFGRWRQQLRMLHALRLLAAGESVTAAALGVGYDSTSAFISAFKSVVGTTPGRYYADAPSEARSDTFDKPPYVGGAGWVGHTAK